MKPFIKLTGIQFELPFELYINTDNIISIYKNSEGKTCIYVISGLIYEVKESIEEITKNISILRIK